MTDKTETTPVSRRGMIAGVTAGTVATAVVVAPAPALAAPTDVVRLGKVNATPSEAGTGLTGSTGSAALLSVDNGADTGVAVHATGHKYGIHAAAATAVRAEGATTGIAATGSDTAVAAASDRGTAVRGRTHSGCAVDARTNNGIAVRAMAADPNGQALQVVGPATFTGRTSFSTAGTVTVAAGTAEVSLPYHGNRTTSFALATPRAYVAGVAVAAAVIDVRADTLTIHLTGPTPVDLPVAYLILD
jgi:hypothetical protein